MNNELSHAEQRLINGLDCDLLDYADEDNPTIFYHLLMTATLYRPITADQIDKINSQFSHLREQAEQAFNEKRFDDYLDFVQRSYRLVAFADELVPLLTDQQYWELLAYIWIDTEFPHQAYDLWQELFASKRPARKALMTVEEQTAFAAMSSTLTVYRGGSTANGLSWTLCKDKARWFAERFDCDGKHQVFKGTVPKNKVYAYLKGRKEEEIVVNPKFVSIEIQPSSDISS